MDAREVAVRVGRQVLAPVLAAWAEAVSERLKRDPALVPLALMRDGAVLGEAAVRRLGRPVTRAWLGRRMAAIAAVADAEDHENLLNLLVRMRHRPTRWAEAAQELELPSPPDDAASHPLTGTTLPRFWNWLATPSVAEALSRRTRQVRQGVLAHLDSLGLRPGAPLLLLDVGYAATVQRCLKRILALAGRQQEVHGLYLITSAGARWAMPGAGTVEGVLAHLGEPQPFAAMLLRHRDLLECLLAQPLGEVLGYDPQGMPLTAATPLPPDQLAQAAAVQATALDHMGECEGSVAAARAALLRLFLHPEGIEVAILGQWLHADSTALDGPRRLADGPADGGRDTTLWPAAARVCSEKC